MNGILTVLTTLFSFASFGAMLWMFWRTNRRINVFEQLAENFQGLFDVSVEGTGEDANVVLDERLGLILKTLASSLASSLKMSILGTISGQKRLEKGLKGAMATDFLEKKAPILNLVADFLGINTADYISDHPDAIMQLLPMFNGFMQGKSFNPAVAKTATGVFDLG